MSSRTARVDPATAVVDVALAFALTAVALTGFGSTYDGRQWLVVGLVGAGLGGALATFLAVRGWGLDVVVLLLVPGYLLSAGPVASSLRSGDRMFEAVIGGTVTSWGELVGTHPPVDGRGVLLLPPYLLGLVTGAVVTSLALRSRSAGAPTGPPVLVFVAALLLGRREPDLLLLPALGLAVLTAAWVLLRGLRREAGFAHGALLPRLLGAGLVLAVAASAAVPLAGRWDLADRPRLVLREVVPAYDVTEVDTPLAGFRRFTDQPPGVLGNVHDSALLTVSGLPAGARLRFAALDTYDQEEFRPGDDTVPGRHDDRFLRIGQQLDNAARGQRAFVNVEVHKAWSSQWVPTAGALQWFGFEGRRSSVRRQGFRYNPATATAVMTSALTSRDAYEFTTVLPEDRLTPAMTPYPRIETTLWEQAKFVDIPAHAWSEGATSPMDAVFRAAATLRRTGRYSDGATGFETKYLPGHDRPRIGPGFIHGSLTGNDEQYAPVMALAAVRLGVPARVVVGAIVPRSGVVTGADVEAWVEVRVADGSWRTLPTEVFMSHRPPGVDRFDQNPDPDIKLPDLPQTEQQPPPPKAERDRPAPEKGPAAAEPLWWPFALVGLVALLLAVPLVKVLRRRGRLHHRRPSRRWAGAWQELVDASRDLGVPVPDGLTRPAQALLLGVPRELADAADRAIFAADPPDPAGAAAYWREVEAARRDLRARASAPRRHLAPFSPASLLRRGGGNGPPKWQKWPAEVAGTHARGGNDARRTPSEAGRLR